MDKFVELYINDHSLSWSDSTLRSERYRLSSLISFIDGNPERLWEGMLEKGLKPYSRATSWTRVTKFYDWLIEEGHIKGPNLYRKWRRKNAKVFKNVYDRVRPEVSFREARQRIGTIEDEPVKRKLLELLTSGMRYSESFTKEDGTIRGKGGKRRRIFSDGNLGSDLDRGSVQLNYGEERGPEGALHEEGSKSYPSFYRRCLHELRARGLKIHDLRKIFATELVNQGANEFELCEIMGWSNLNTASSYVKASDKKLRDLVRRVNND